MAVRPINDNTYFGEESQALISIIDDHFHFAKRDDEGGISTVWVGKEQGDIWYWGANNNLPYEREVLVRQNNVMGELVATKRGIVLGSGLTAYKERYENGKVVKEPVEIPPKIRDFFEKVQIDRYLQHAAKNLLFHGNVFTELIRGRGTEQIVSLESKECRHVRAEKMRMDGKIHNFYWCGAWHKVKRDRHKIRVEKIPAYTSKRADKRFILHSGDNLLTDDYYYIPAWWGARQWLLLANCIPDFHLANLKHGYNIRYHIQIPKGYFFDYSSAQQSPNDLEKFKGEEAAAKQDFLDRMNDFLAGVANSGRAVFTTYEINKQMGKEFPGIKIDPISVDLQDDALLALFEKSNQANISAQGIHPTLAAIETSGKLSSGTEIRNAFLMYVAIKTPTPRNILLEPIRLIQKINGWDPELKWWFKDIELTTLDKEPTGLTEAVNS
jgi:hypothetical protein